MFTKGTHNTKIQPKMVELKNSVEQNEVGRTTNSPNPKPNNSDEAFGCSSIGDYPI